MFVRDLPVFFFFQGAITAHAGTHEEIAVSEVRAYEEVWGLNLGPVRSPAGINFREAIL